MHEERLHDLGRAVAAEAERLAWRTKGAERDHAQVLALAGLEAAYQAEIARHQVATAAQADEALATPEAKHTATLDVTEAAAVNAAAGAGAAGTGRALADEAGRAQGAEEARLAAAGEALATGEAKEAAARRPGQASAEAAAAAEASASAADEKGLTLEEKWPEPAEELVEVLPGHLRDKTMRDNRKQKNVHTCTHGTEFVPTAILITTWKSNRRASHLARKGLVCCCPIA